MESSLQSIRRDIQTLLAELSEHVAFMPKQLFVVGCSTSEMMGANIGSAGTEEAAAVLYEELTEFAARHQLYLRFK